MKLSKCLALLAVCAVGAASGCALTDSTMDSIWNTASSEMSFWESAEEGSSSISSIEDGSSEGKPSDGLSSEETSSGNSSSEGNTTPEEGGGAEEKPEEGGSSAEEPKEEEKPEDEEPKEEDEFAYLKTDGRCVAIDVQNSISDKKGKMSFITKDSYQGIKRIAFNAKTGDTVSWWGIALADDCAEASLYNTDLTVGYTSTGSHWVTFVFDFTDTGCAIYSTQGGYAPRVLKELAKVPYSVDGAYYIHFVGPLWETFSTPVYLDNFTIELMDGTTYVDSFDEGADTGLFFADKAVTHTVDEAFEEKEIHEEETPMYEVNEVFYESEEQIDFTAYAPVTVEDWGGSWTSNPNLVTEEQYRYMAEAGFTKALGLYEGRSGDSGYTSNEKAEKDALAVLEFAEKYGILYYVLNEKFYNFVRPEINIEFFDLTSKDGKYYNADGEEVSSFEAYKYLKSNWMSLYKAKMSAMFDDEEYIDSVAYGGNFASDEPALPLLVDGEWYYGELEQLYYQLLLYDTYMMLNGAEGEAYVNLLPYGSVNEDNRARYEAMLEYYFSYIAPLLGYVSYDHYPLNQSVTAYVSTTHLLNLELMANYCKKYGVELRSFLWAKTEGTGHRALIGANDLRFQAYANLAFGVKEMPYYTYFNYYAPGTDGCDSLIDCQTGERTQAYYWAKEVNNEIHSLEKAYLNFTWEGTMYYDMGLKNQQFSLLETSMDEHHRLTDIRAGADVLVGVFSDADGVNGATDGFLVMNYSDPYYENKGEKDNMVLTFANATHALVYKDGKQYMAELTDGVLSMYLEAGEGVFVVPITK